MTDHDNRALLAAQKLLTASSTRPEDNIRQDIARLLEAMKIDTLLTYRTQSGPADIYLPQRRVFFETKVVGKANDPHIPQTSDNSETAFQQLERYLSAERDDELGRLPFDEQPDLQWTGFVTDGRIWHAWRFPHAQHNSFTCALDGFRPKSAEELLSIIKPLVSTTPVGKPWIPTNPVHLFVDALDSLRTIHAEITGARVRQGTDTKMRLWLDMLRGSGMAPATEVAQARLFTAHCFLVALARGVVHTLLKPNLVPDPKELLGNGYLAWIIEIEAGRNWSRDFLDRIHAFEWRRTAGDVLRPLYEQFVDQSDRNDFGEVYTPDWLAEMMVEDVLDEEWCNEAVVSALAKGRPDGIGVLDPTCGSGTFLYHCARRILASNSMRSLTAVRKADVVCQLVNGIDIHPVAVEFSKATLLRALPATPTAADMAPAVYQGDALMLRQTDKNTLFDPKIGEILIRSPQGREIVIPRAFSEHTDFADMLRRMVESAANGDPLPVDISAIMRDDKEKVKKCHESLTKIIKAEGNSVWTWYITNVLGPDRLERRKVNRIVANPPWVKLAHIQVKERKRALESLAGKDDQAGNLALWTGGIYAPHFDIAQLFICHARTRYLHSPEADPAAWVTKASAIRAGHWKRFRNWHSKFLAQVVDLSDAKVFGGGDARRSCVLFEVRRSSLPVIGGDGMEISAKCPDGTPEAAMPWRGVVEFLLQWEVPNRFPEKPSAYEADGWRQGATVVPKVLTEAATVKTTQGDQTKLVTTSLSGKHPWNGVQPRTGEVPMHWLMPLLNSKQLLPFGLAPAGLDTIIVPCDENEKLLPVENARKSDFWAELDDLYREHKGIGGNTPKNLLKQIDYARKLSAHLPLCSQSCHMVIYPASGDVMRAAHISQGLAVTSSGIYRRAVGSIAEARYLVGVLNAPSLELAFRLCRTSGRHFQKAPWRSVPVPKWHAKNSIHQDLATLSERAEETVAVMDLPTGQIAASNRIRKQLTEDGTFAKIDSLVGLLLPKHVSSR
ncbi:MAG: hypothetical protein OXF74_00385 [Rhodobacteraceae bacterium]|nr:hypothetical protein [Paracoccaceae bacterium]